MAEEWSSNNIYTYLSLTFFSDKYMDNGLAVFSFSRNSSQLTEVLIRELKTGPLCPDLFVPRWLSF